MKTVPVQLIDAGTGNLRSVANALQRAGAEVQRVSAAAEIRPGTRLVLPGVGAFGRFMHGLRAAGLDDALRAAVQSGTPVLGICVGMQALFEAGEEQGEHAGLGLLPGRVLRFSPSPGLKIPHTGWNTLEPRGEQALLAGLPAPAFAYFNHSYYCAAADPADVAARTPYPAPFASAVARGSLQAVQFHPEKSQQTGLRLLENFLHL